MATTVFHDGPYKTLADIECATAGWVNWYNHRRLHSTFGRLTQPSTNKPTTLPSSRRNNPHESGKEAVTLHTADTQP